MCTTIKTTDLCYAGIWPINTMQQQKDFIKIYELEYDVMLCNVRSQQLTYMTNFYKKVDAPEHKVDLLKDI